MRVFLGGTCNNSKWRNIMMIYLHNESIDYFNPVVDDWDDTAKQSELNERENCDICLYAITPLMTGVYSIAEVVDDSNKRPDKTVLVILQEDNGSVFTKAQVRSLKSVAAMVKRNGGRVYYDLHFAAKELAR